MRDLVYVATTLGFFGVAALFLAGCARIVGPDDPSLGHEEPHGDPQPVEGADPVGLTR